jgi:hypothetical protein
MLMLAFSMMLAGCSYRVSPEELATFGQLRTPQGAFAEEAICHLHRIETIEFVTKELAGMCVKPSCRLRPYIKARVRLFPNSYWDTRSCSCEPLGGIRFVRVCPACRDAERLWRSEHGMPLDEEYPLSDAD